MSCFSQISYLVTLDLPSGSDTNPSLGLLASLTELPRCEDGSFLWRASKAKVTEQWIFVVTDAIAGRTLASSLAEILW